MPTFQFLTTGYGMPIAFGSATLVNGVVTLGMQLLATAPANGFGMASSILLTRSSVNTSTSIGQLVALTSDRTSTSFKVKSVDTTGAVVTGDQSTFDFFVVVSA